MGILARLRLAKIRTMARPNSPDMPPKRTKKIRLGINTIIMRSRQVFRLKIDFDTLIMPNQSEEKLRGLTCTRICYVRQCVFVVVVVVHESDGFP